MKVNMVLDNNLVRILKCSTNCCSIVAVLGWVSFCLQALWRGVLHHLVGDHDWLLGDGGGPGKCAHAELTPEQIEAGTWLERGSKAHIRLRDIVLNKRLLGNIAHYVHFRLDEITYDIQKQ